MKMKVMNHKKNVTDSNTVSLLLVEDNPGDARLFELILSDTPGILYTLSWAKTMADALSLLASAQYDIIFSDLTLPDSKDIDTFFKLHEHAPDVPIIILSGFEDEERKNKIIESGATAFLNKGEIDAQMFSEVIAEVVT